jgi:hypothetical protein
MGDACEMLIVSELMLAGVPAVKMPDNWPGFDIAAFPKGNPAPQRISVKSRTFKRGRDCYVDYDSRDDSFDWLAFVILPNSAEGEPNRRVFIFPKSISDVRFYQYGSATKYRDFKSGQIDLIADMLPEFEDNFRLSPTGNPQSI